VCICIWVITAFIAKEAFERINTPGVIDEKIMLYTSIFGLLCNIIMIKTLHSEENSHHFHNQNKECSLIEQEDSKTKEVAEKKEGTFKFI
jgi:Co/Zn/Cd efflux system component